MDHLKARHPLRTEKLKQLGHPLNAYTDNATLLNALSQWEAMKDAEIRTTVASSVETELATLRQRNAELETQAAQHAERHQRDDQSNLDRVRALREQVEKETEARTQAEHDRRELSRGVDRLCDHITTRSQALPTLSRPYEWYRQWAEHDRTSPPPATQNRWQAVAKHYQPQWGQQLLQRLWSGAAWTRPQLLGAAPTPRARSLLQEFIEHGLVALHDPEGAALLTVEDSLRDFADHVGAALGPRKPSPVTAALSAVEHVPVTTGRQLLRILATAARDHQVTVANRKAGALPLFRLRNRNGPTMPARWLLPWLPEQEPLLRELLTRARNRDAATGLAVAGLRPHEGADDRDWGPLVQAAGYEPQLVKRIWMDEPSTPPPEHPRVT
ncbi:MULTISPECIES: hypothetical protein [unclassified Crossiella]|uniref:hypothetical protein n=1 Tax=unclassified Crossiella TaxID=2620835 RepID=UPI002000126B|nr:MULTISPECIES: hypothetical protein [unclassified Crossiella]MCK2240926.1 hypothetical protein [Crossiella sp. S99.2]MCK2253930.1 hypothetical protein [Crossiella sp. S99.1]